jgi:hypothetical protein
MSNRWLCGAVRNLDRTSGADKGMRRSARPPVNHARGYIQEGQRQVREQWQHEQQELQAWQRQQNEQ